jgi:hypothetical protein
VSLNKFEGLFQEALLQVQEIFKYVNWHLEGHGRGTLKKVLFSFHLCMLISIILELSYAF